MNRKTYQQKFENQAKAVSREGDVERKSVKIPGLSEEKEVCQERRACQVRGSRAVNRRGCQDSEMTSANGMERKWHHQKKKLREKCQGEKDVRTSSKQPEGLSRSRDVRSKPDQEKVAASDKMSRKRNVKDKEVGRWNFISCRMQTSSLGMA